MPHRILKFEYPQNLSRISRTGGRDLLAGKLHCPKPGLSHGGHITHMQEGCPRSFCRRSSSHPFDNQSGPYRQCLCGLLAPRCPLLRTSYQYLPAKCSRSSSEDVPERTSRYFDPDVAKVARSRTFPSL